jgi:hypothetical protein
MIIPADKGSDQLRQGVGKRTSWRSGAQSKIWNGRKPLLVFGQQGMLVLWSSVTQVIKIKIISHAKLRLRMNKTNK